MRYQKQFWPRLRLHRLEPGRHHLHVPAARRTATTWRRAWPWPGTRRATAARRCTPPTASSTTTRSRGIVQHHRRHRRRADSVRTLVQRSRPSLAAWRAPGHRLPEPGRAAFPSLVISHRPRPQDALGAPGGARHRPRARPRLLGGGELRLRARQAPARQHRLQPDRSRRSAPAGGPTTWAAARAPPPSILQYTSFGETLVPGPDGLREQAVQRQLPAPRLVHALRRRRTTRPTSRASFSRRTRARPEPGRPHRPADRLRSDGREGPGHHDQRHRFVFCGLLPLPLGLHALRRSSPRRPAGRSTRSRAPTSTATATAARSPPTAPGATPPTRPAASAATAETMDGQFNVDLRLSKRFRFGGRGGGRC